MAYSTPEEAYKELIPAFNETPEGEGVGFDQSYASSGEQSRAVEGGLPADVVEFSLEPDITRLVDAGLVDKDWNQNEHDGIVTDSVVVFIVRKGNPKNIKSWDDLVTGDVEVLEPNPFTSGSAKWNIMAAYGAQLEQGKTPEEAKQYLAQLFENVPVLDKSARESLQTFSSGKGDVLLGYENEAILAQQEGEEVDYVDPGRDDPDREPDRGRERVAEPASSRRPSSTSSTPRRPRRSSPRRATARWSRAWPAPDQFPTPAKLFEIGKFGGWDKVNDEFFDPEQGVVAEIFQSQGKSTASD